MSDTAQRTINVLNLSKEISSELKQYFEEKSISVSQPDSGSVNWTHVLVDGDQDFESVEKTYQVVANDIKLIALSRPENLKSFISNNGKLVFDKLWLSSNLGKFILDKFFQEYAGVDLSDNYPSFQEKGSFNITNPFGTGEYLDRLVYHAFENGMSGLSVKTFFDHLVMYLTALKNKGIAGMPIEVTYGNFEAFFGIQLHFFTQSLTTSTIAASLTNTITKVPEEYLLNVAIQSSDFFDFTYLKQVNKAVITALWTDDESFRIENRGLMFLELASSAKLSNLETDGESSFLIQNSINQDMSDKVNLPGVEAQEFTEAPLEVKPWEPEEEAAQVISGTDEDIEDVTQIVKGKMEEENFVTRIAGQKFDVDDFAYKIAAGVKEKAKDEGNIKVKSLSENLPDNLKKGLFDFAKKVNKKLDDLDESDMITFKDKVVPEIIQNEVMKVKKLDAPKVNNDAAMASAVKAAKHEAEKKNNELQVENDKLKSQVRALMSEVRINKEMKAKLMEAQKKAQEEAESASSIVVAGSEAGRNSMIQKLASGNVSTEDLAKIQEVMERDAQTMELIKQEEIKSKKIQIEAAQKETIFNKELEKLQREIKARDLLINKTKDSLAKLNEKKEADYQEFQEKLDQANKVIASANTPALMGQIRDLEKQNLNHTKMIDSYKAKISSLTSNMESNNGEDGSFKDEARKAQIANTQLKNQLEITKRELQKFQDKAAADLAIVNNLKQEKVKLEQQVKKSIQDAPKEQNNTQQLENELKRVLSQSHLFETQLKDAITKVKDLEQKLSDASKVQKTQNFADDSNKKVIQLENSFKTVSQDLLESRNQTAEMKKVVNKLRQEKVALQNQIDKLKKDSEKGVKGAAPKKPMGGKAA